MSFSIPDTYHAYFGEIYDIFYGAEVEPTINFLIFITNLFNISLIQSKILDLGCGTGRLLIPLLERGFTIIGSEPSKAMREIVRDKLNKKSLYTTIYEFYAHQIMPIGSFNIILLIDNVFQNYLTRREQIEALNVLYSSLESKGLITEQGCPKNVQLFLSQTLILDYHTIKTRHLSSKVGHLGRYSMKSLKHKVR